MHRKELLRRPRTGMTLIELVIAMLVMGILTAVSAPRYVSAIKSFRLEAAAKRIAADLNLARKNAMAKGGGAQGEWVSFYPSTHCYKLHGDPDLDRPGQEYWVYLQETTYPVDLVSATFTNQNALTSNQTVKYDMYGCARSGNPQVRLALGQIVVASAGEQRIVTIDPTTGEASVQ